MNIKLILAPLVILGVFLGYLFLEKSNQTNNMINNGFVFYENPTRHLFKSSILFSNGITELSNFKQDKQTYHKDRAKLLFESSLGFINQKKYAEEKELFDILVSLNNQAIELTNKEFDMKDLSTLQTQYAKALVNLEQERWINVGNLYQLTIEKDDRFTSTLIVLGVLLFIIAIAFTYLFHQYSKKLQHSVKNFGELFNLTQEAIVIFDHNYKIANVNQSAKKIFKYDGGEIIGRNMFDFVPKEELEKVKKSLTTQKSEPFELVLLKSDGTKFPALASGGNIIRDGEKYRVTTIVDLTQLKEQEFLLLQQSRLALLGEMIGNIAHQWRQPLSLITTTISALEFKQEFQQISNEDIIKANKTILQAANYLSTTIDTFRNFSNQKQINVEFNISETINTALDIVKASYANNFIKLESNFDTELRSIGNHNLLSQVILNILGNAKDALGEADISHKIVHLNLEQIETKIIISIKDNGGGIKEEIIDKIFDPYFTTKHQSQGTGLGLYMSKQIIHQYFNGTIEISNQEDENGSGAKFIITFPIKSLNEI